MTLLPLTVVQPFGDYKHGDLIDTEDAVMHALEHHPHYVVQIAGEVKPAVAAEVLSSEASEAKPRAKSKPSAK